MHILDILYKCSHTIDDLCAWLHVLGTAFSRSSQAVACTGASGFFMTNIPLYGYTTFRLSVPQLMAIWIISLFDYYD